MEITCSRCRRPYVQAVKIDSVADRALSLLYSRPFRCQVCRRRFHLLQWGVCQERSVSERREYERRPVRTSASLLNEHGDLVGVGIVKNLSMGGCAIETEAHLPMGSLLRLKIDAIGQQPAITVESAIVRSVRVSSSRGPASAWNSCGSAARSRLSDYMLTLLGGTHIDGKGRLEEPAHAR
jgi:hypothetical protein